MCRLFSYLGPPATLDALLYAPEYALVRQAHEPRHQRHGRINADGFGVGWYAPELREEPARYRTTAAMWADNSFRSVAGVIRSGAVVAAVRSASPGLPIDESCTAPYTHSRWLFAHNGRIEGFPGATAARLRRRLSDARTADMACVTDSEVLFGLVLDRLDAGACPSNAIVDVVREVQNEAPGSRLNLCLSDGATIVATACGDSLFTRSDDDRGSVIVASEPFDDDPTWQQVDEGSLVIANRSSLDVGVMP